MEKIYFFRYRFLVLFIFLANWVFAQTGSVSGRVIDQSNQGLPGATVSVKGTPLSASTDANGYFKLNGLAVGQQVLVVHFIGYQPSEQPISVPGSANITVQLLPAANALNEVAVIGYGTVKKSDATGSVDVITAKDLNKGAVNSVQDAMLGKLPGVVITSISGAPGNTSTIRIRGVTSINASTDPLIVIDNVPVDNTPVGGSANILSAINPNDIENITVLKDASATAIYGSRGSSGVILITTKRGSKDLNINYNNTFSESVLPKYVDVYSADQFRTLVNQVYAGQTAVTSLLGTANTNWQKQIYQNAFGQDHNVSVSGSTKNMPYRVSVGYNNSDGVLKTYNFQRTTVDVGLDPSLLNHTLNIHINLKGLYNTNNFAEQAAIGNAVNFDPTQPVYNGNTRWRGYTTWTTNGDVNGPPVTLATANPVAQLDLTDNKSTVRRSIGNVQFDYKLPFLPDLHANANVGYDYTDGFGHNNVKDSTQWVYIPVVAGGRIDNYNTVTRNQLFDFYLNYSKKLKDIKSEINVTGGYSWSHFYREGNDISSDYNMTVSNPENPYKTEYYLASFFGRLNYTFDEKYQLTLTVRDDGTSRFSPQQRWGLFPAAAFSWRIKDENFLKDSRTVSDLKLRVSYGTTGQQDLANNNNYPYLAKFTKSDATSRYQFGDALYYTYRPEGYDANIKWESTTTSNIGIDYGFWNNRITGSVDAYYKKTKDLLNVVNVPAGTNFSATILTNVGDMENKGVEFNINAILVATRDWNWQLGYNVSYNQNKVTRLALNNDPNYTIQLGGIQGTTSGTIQADKVGYPVNSYFVFQQVYYPNGKPIESVYVDRNNDNLINSSDQYIYKHPDPDVVMGINSKLSYKQWDLSFSGRLSLGNYNYNNVAANSTYRGLYSSLGYLSNQTTNASYTQFYNALNTNLSDYYIQNASFFRMDNISLGYRFARIDHSKIRLRINAGVQNVFVITPYKGLDPEISGGLDNNFFPRARIYQLGLNASF